MSYEEHAQASMSESQHEDLEIRNSRKWPRQWLVTSILLGPALGLTAAAILFYITPKIFEARAELHYASLHPGEPLLREKLEAEMKNITDPNNIAEIEATVLQHSKNRTISDMPSVNLDATIKGEIIYITAKHPDYEFARNVANLIVTRHKKQHAKTSKVDEQLAEKLIEQALNEEKKLPTSTQELLQLQSRLDLLDRAQGRHEMLVAYASEPCTFREELLAYQRDYLKPEALSIDSTKAEIEAKPLTKDLDQRWLKLVGEMERHRNELLATIKQRKATAPTTPPELTIFSEIQHNGLIAEVQDAAINHVPKEPELTTYLVTGSVTGLVLLPLLSLLGLIRTQRKSLNATHPTVTP